MEVPEASGGMADASPSEATVPPFGNGHVQGHPGTISINQGEGQVRGTVHQEEESKQTAKSSSTKRKKKKGSGGTGPRAKKILCEGGTVLTPPLLSK